MHAKHARYQLRQAPVKVILLLEAAKKVALYTIFLRMELSASLANTFSVIGPFLYLIPFTDRPGQLNCGDQIVGRHK